MRRALLAAAAVLALAGCQAGPGAIRHAQYDREYRYARRIFGDGRAQQRCLLALWDQESGWDPYAVNGQSGAAGIPQANPADFGHPFALGDWRGQIRWGARYIDRRYGSPCAAEDHEAADGWY